MTTETPTPPITPGPFPPPDLTPEMAATGSFLLDPVQWGERMLANRDGSPRRYRDYQALDLRCPDRRVVHLDGRAVGKTVNLSTLLLYSTFVNRGFSVLVAAPYQGQLNTIIEEVEHQLAHSDLLRANIARKPGGGLKIKHHPYFEVTFRNGCSAYFRPAGDDGDVFRSLHVDLLLVDEAAWFSKRAWTAIRQCLNPGGVFRVYSTPNGVRTNPYYDITNSKHWRRFHWPSWIAPGWSPEHERDLQDFYGGRSTPGWQHEVAGEHGATAYSAFNVAHVLAAVTDIDNYRRVDITGAALAGAVKEREVRERLETLLLLDGGHGTFWLGGDLGYTSDPTELALFEEDSDGVLTLVLRVHAEHVAYPVISEMIAFIDRTYNPAGIGIDRGGNGLSVEQELLGLDKFRHDGFAGRLVGYDFGGSICVGQDEHGKEIRKRVKEHMSLLITKALAAQKVRLPRADAEVEDQLCSQTYVLNDSHIVYSKGDDHIIDAMRCALLRRAQATEPGYEPTVIIPDFHILPVDIPGWI